MKGKYRNFAVYGLAFCRREFLRKKLSTLVSWQNQTELTAGCTIVIGMPRLLSGVLNANLRCLNDLSIPSPTKVVVVVDGELGCLPAEFERSVQLKYARLDIVFHFYSKNQCEIAESLKLPYVYAWLSWCIGISKVSTKYFLIHDFDALVFEKGLETRYAALLSTKAKLQGVFWYEGNGIRSEDKLLTTFELLVKTDWVRSFHPIDLFNKVAYTKGRSVDFDILLELQERHLEHADRSFSPMAMNELIHPSQMIHQFTVCRKFPGEPLPCFSLINIPLFLFFGGNLDAVSHATTAIRSRDSPSKSIHLIEGGPLMNFTLLLPEHVDWSLEQMITACKNLRIAPRSDVIEYGEALYDLVGADKPQRWGKSLSKVRDWFSSEKASELFDSASPE
jgi:hypothetical protein